ncbi:hypothetical protein CS549_07965 [Porphyromonas gingivalis]|nr:hypothetical protein CS549_07965 [Porphyromonas gingivalis]
MKGCTPYPWSLPSTIRISNTLIRVYSGRSIIRPILRPLHGDWCVFCLLIHCIIGSYFVYLSIKNSIIFLPWHTNPRIPMSM